DLRVIERLDHIFLVERARLFNSGRPQPQAPEHAWTRTAGGELGVSWIQDVVPVDQFRAEWIVDVLVVVEAAVQTFHMRGWHEVEEVLVEVRADERATPPREPGLVQQLEERCQPGRNNRVEHDLGAT